MSQFNTYPMPKEGGGRTAGGKSHKAEPGNKPTKDAPDGQLGSFSYKGKGTSYYKSTPSMPEKQ